ncbi:MAG: DNA methyltransferase [Anaerolineae bacterium]
MGHRNRAALDDPSTTGQGDHRLLCGDSTNADDVAQLMDGRRAVLFATDPPYLVGYDGTNHPHAFNEPDTNKDWSATYHDWDDPEDGEGLYDGFIHVAQQLAITPEAAWYCWHASRRQAMLERIWNKYGAFVHQQIVWVKDRPILTRSWYMWQHEPCLFGWVQGKKPKRIAEDYPSTVWHVPTIPPGEKSEHPTSKPVELFATPMLQHTVSGDLCYEPFSGSGTQFVAAEQLGRLVYGVEKEPVYCAVILQRLKAMGLAPKRIA